MRIALAAALALGVLASSNNAYAIGCVSGAAAGAVAGHVAGHHAVAGAVVGCIAGHEAAKAAKKHKQAVQQGGDAAAPAAH